jgi:hypothetical protein
MIQKLLETFVRTESRPATTAGRYHPQRPLGFVRRSDPSFYFLSKR